ncbi:hypothetical protein [Haloferula sp.]|uniref:hypothetical protein n=1 Tax=Haloferula sp. TaxID=2497595 RepID=UPI003C722137
MKNNRKTQFGITNLGRKITLGLAAAFALGFSGTALAQEHTNEMHGKSHDKMRMDHILTQAQAEALKPGDSMAMTCSKCKYVIVQKVTDDNAHVKMMTVGEKMKCVACDGDVVVVATGKGEGKHAEVKHVCSHCGDDAMFCTATKAGSGTMMDGEHGEHKKGDEHKEHGEEK